MRVCAASASVSSVECSWSFIHRILHQTSPHATGSYSKTLLILCPQPQRTRFGASILLSENSRGPSTCQNFLAYHFSFLVMSQTSFSCRSSCVRLPFGEIPISCRGQDLCRLCLASASQEEDTTGNKIKQKSASFPL